MYIVIEIQRNGSGLPALLTNVYDSQENALQKYFTVLAAAAVSTLTVHSAVLMTEGGEVLRSESFGR